MCQIAGYDIFDLEKYCPWKEVAPFWEAAQTASNQPTAKSIEKQQAAEVDTHIDTPPHASLSINLFDISLILKSIRTKNFETLKLINFRKEERQKSV